MIPFTPRNRDNLIGLMMARCDGDHLGEKVVMLLSKQEIILGPMQMEARINQDQNISKDLTLWNQQGSQVLRGQMLVLAGRAYVPVRGADLYPGVAGQDAAVEEGRAGYGQQSRVRRYVSAGAGAIGGREPARSTGALAPRNNRRRQPQPRQRQLPTPASRKYGGTCSAIGNWCRRASCRRLARSWRQFSRWWRSDRVKSTS